MLITKKCMLTAKQNSLNIDITSDQLLRVNNRHITGEYIQDIVPNLSPSEREFLMTGILDETWQKYMSEENFTDNTDA